MNPALNAIQKRRAASAQRVNTRFHLVDDTMTVQRTQDCTPIAEYAMAQSAAGFTGSSEMKHAARIPMVIVEKYCNERGITYSDFMRDPAHIKRITEDPDNAAFRIWKGRL